MTVKVFHAELGTAVATGLLGLAGVIGATSQQYPLKMASMGIEAIAAFAKDGTKPQATEGLDFTDLLKQLEIDATPQARHVAVRFGGPVEPGRGFVLHRATDADDIDEGEGRMRIGESDLAMTTTRDILEDLARGQGPDAAVLSLGYAGWDAGQLESEVLANGWLVAEAGDELIFGTDNARKWHQALKSLGVDPLALSTAAGHA